MIREQQSAGVKFFESVGFSVTYAVHEDMFILSPLNSEERKRYGCAVLSVRAVEEIGDSILGNKVAK
jgi:hypothetical protein